MKSILLVADRFIKQSDWKTLALMKACLGSIGLVIGLFVPKENRRPVLVGALAVFLASYIPLAIKFFGILFNKEDCDDCDDCD